MDARRRALHQQGLQEGRRADGTAVYVPFPSGPFRSPDDSLVYDFDVTALLEAKINDRWCKVDPNAFRSWTGPRRLDGEPYVGPNYFFLTNERVVRHG